MYRKLKIFSVNDVSFENKIMGIINKKNTTL